MLIHSVAVLAQEFFTLPHNKLNTPHHRYLWQRICTLLNGITAETLKIKESLAPVEYYSVYESSVFTICVFVLKRGTIMPIHDHPDMTVFSKIVSGDMFVKTFEFLPKSNNDLKTVIDPTTLQPCTVHRTRLGLNRVVSAGSPESLMIIEPGQGANLHSFEAVSDRVVLLDLIGPPYNGDTRRCTYFTPLTPSHERLLLSSPLSSSITSADDSKLPLLLQDISQTMLKASRAQDHTSKSIPSPDIPTSKSSSFPGADTSKRHQQPSTSPGLWCDGSSSDSSENDSQFKHNGSSRPYHYASPPSEGQEYCWLMENDNVDYECTERTYCGARVHGDRLIRDSFNDIRPVIEKVASYIESRASSAAHSP
ncbi:uncharacterized protein BJ171DRAFT_201826 [Polychytrium aggregatum]|uniref:uncharacterized protein n=1 Tax=Polychytrium aggregatum TaxID=110093 RepID=UPI0022FDE25B|nr:uncharacterized protein BJ171DRAFT_201826 [Polychytrium aggregatum]KAI9199727.1 hypothetical protein BJ171DRAFT_201826 [Polychytrium aggregatum]